MQYVLLLKLSFLPFFFKKMKLHNLLFLQKTKIIFHAQKLFKFFAISKFCFSFVI